MKRIKVEQLDWSKLMPKQQQVIVPVEEKVKVVEPKMKEYEVKIKDQRQNVTHKLHQFAKDKNEANVGVLNWLNKALRHNDLDVM